MQNTINKIGRVLIFCLVFTGGLAHAQTREHADASITVRLAAPPAVVFPLFGPVREAEWSPHWNPKFLFPAEKSQVAGAVFTTQEGEGEAVWVMDIYDEPTLRITYVIVLPGTCVARLEIVLNPGPNNTTEAFVTHHFTALSEAGDKYVKENAKSFPDERDHWEHAINHRLAEMKEK
jgi:hypothetical protein